MKLQEEGMRDVNYDDASENSKSKFENASPLIALKRKLTKKGEMI